MINASSLLSFVIINDFYRTVIANYLGINKIVRIAKIALYILHFINRGTC